MMPPDLIYALTKDEQREALKREAARHRLVRLLSADADRGERHGRRARSRS